MQALPSYPVFEADQVLSSGHLNNLLNYLEQQGRLTRIKLLGRGIVCGLEINRVGNSILIRKGVAVASQGFLIQHCETRYTHVLDYSPPDLPDDLYFLRHCEDADRNNIPFYASGNVLELVPEGENREGRLPINNARLQNRVVVLFLEATQTDLKNCDTQDCNDKGSRMDFVLRPLLVRVQDLQNPRQINFRSILLKRFNVPSGNVNGTLQIQQGFLNITDDTTLRNLSENLRNSWERFAPQLGLPEANPLRDFDLIRMRGQITGITGYRIYIQYFYDFVDDLLKAYIEFRSKVREVFGECCPDEMDFPMHVALGLATLPTLMGRRNAHRHYFQSSPALNGQQKTLDEAATLLQRMAAMANNFSIMNLNAQDPIRITPSNLGSDWISYRAIPYYYDWEKVNPFWYFSRANSGNEAYNLGYRAAAQSTSPEPVRNPLLYDIERFNAFRIEGHVGKNYLTALREIIRQKHEFNLPIDVIALNAVDLSRIANREEIQCHVQDLQSDYRVLITGIVCHLQQIMAYVAELRPNRDQQSTAVITGRESAKAGFNISDRLINFSNNVLFSAEPNRQEIGSKNVPKDYFKNVNVDYSRFVQDLTFTEAGQEEKLVDFISVDLAVFNTNYRRWFDHIIAQPDYLVIFLRQLSDLVVYLLAHPIQSFVKESYLELWDKYAKTVEVLIEEAQDANDENIRRYFSRGNQDLLFKCTNERLFALLQEYQKRLDEYSAATNFQQYFQKNPGLEHKAGVTKGGTFVLVYHRDVPAATNTASIREVAAVSNLPSSNMAISRLEIANQPSNMEAMLRNRAGNRVVESINIAGNPRANITFNNPNFAHLASSLQRLDLGIDLSNLLQEMARRDEEQSSGNIGIARGTVIADFYLPYRCCSDCPPIAYVFETEREPEETTPEPTISMDRTEFCFNDRAEYPVSVSPEGGTFSVNGNEQQALAIIPASLAVGSANLSYTVGDQTANLEIQIHPIITGSINIRGVEFDREGGWTIGFGPIIADQNASHEWSRDGNTLSETGEITQNYAMARGSSELGLRVFNQGPCQDFNTNIQLEFEATGAIICGNQNEFSYTFEHPEEITLVEKYEDVRVSGNTITILPSSVLDGPGDSFMVPVFQRTENGYRFTVLAFTQVDASFRIRFSMNIPAGRGDNPPSAVSLIRGGETARNEPLNIELTPIVEAGTSTWRLNNTVRPNRFQIPMEELASMRQLAFIHSKEVREADCSDSRNFSISPQELGRQLIERNGNYEVTVN